MWTIIFPLCVNINLKNILKIEFAYKNQLHILPLEFTY
jgi:hypothetical protein